MEINFSRYVYIVMESIRVRHSGEHLLIGSLIKNLEGARVVRVVHENVVDKAFIEYDGVVTWEDVVEASIEANRQVVNDTHFRVEYFPSLEDARRRYPDLRAYDERLHGKESIRVVIIEGFDKAACKNEHVERAGEVKLVIPRLLRRVRRGLYEVEFYTGWNAILYAIETSSKLYRSSRILGSSLEGLIEAIESLRNGYGRLETGITSLTDHILYNWPIDDGRGKILLIDAPYLNMKRIVAIGRRVLRDRGLQLLAVVSYDGEKHNVFLSSLEIDIESLKKRVVEEAGGKGGGGRGFYIGYVDDPDAFKKLVYEFMGGE